MLELLLLFFKGKGKGFTNDGPKLPSLPGLPG